MGNQSFVPDIISLSKASGRFKNESTHDASSFILVTKDHDSLLHALSSHIF